MWREHCNVALRIFFSLHRLYVLSRVCVGQPLALAAATEEQLTARPSGRDESQEGDRLAY